MFSWDILFKQGQNGFFSLGLVTSQGKGKLFKLSFTPLKN